MKRKQWIEKFHAPNVEFIHIFRLKKNVYQYKKLRTDFFEGDPPNK